MPDGAGLPRRSVDEFVTLHSLDPEIRSVVVEGVRDAGVIRWYLGLGRSEAAIYTVGEIDVPGSLLATHGLHGGNRDRVICLAIELAGRLPSAENQILCIADADVDRALATLRNSPALAYTDYVSMDSYLLSTDVFDKFLRVGMSGRMEMGAGDLIARLGAVLRRLFLIRLAILTLRLGVSPPDFLACCGISDQAVRLNEKKLLDRVVQKARAAPRRAELETEISRLDRDLGRDPRDAAHGQDLFALLAWFMRKQFRRGPRLPEDISSVLYSCLDRQTLEGRPLFRRLRRFDRGEPDQLSLA